MSLNIKNPVTYRLAKELADATGESMTSAVTEAIRERLGRVRAERGGDESQIDRLLALAREIGDRMPPGYLDIDHGDLLYDEMGLPK